MVTLAMHNNLQILKLHATLVQESTLKYVVLYTYTKLKLTF